jgi:hypothetical protein
VGSSIGHIGEEPVASSSCRLKGFLTDVLDQASLPRFKESFDSYRTRVLDPNAAETRLSLRVVCRNDVVEQLPAREAMIPLGEGLTLVYIGLNTPERSLSSGESERLELRRRSAADSGGRNGRADVGALVRNFEQAFSRGYSISLVASRAERGMLLARHCREIGSLLGVFGYDQDDAAEIVEDPANLIGIARHLDEVVGISVAETVEVVLRRRGDDVCLRLAELTDSNVTAAHTGSSLQLLIHLKLIESMVERNVPPDMIFSESTYGGSLHNAATMGRTFAGRLPNHAIVESGYPAVVSSVPVYQSLEVTYLPLSSALQLVRALKRKGAFELPVFGGPTAPPQSA